MMSDEHGEMNMSIVKMNQKGECQELYGRNIGKRNM